MSWIVFKKNNLTYLPRLKMGIIKQQLRTVILKMETLVINRPATYSRSSLNVVNWLTGISTGFIVLFFIYYCFIYSFNFPFQDDSSFLYAIVELQKGLGWQHDVHTFFRPENDHRIFLPRLVGYIDFLLTGHLNFKAYILISLFNLILVAGFIYRLFRQMNIPFYYFLPIPFFIFQPQYHEVSLWALTGLQHISLLLILSICVLLLRRAYSTGRMITAIALAFLATFTHGNGIMVFAAGGFLLLIERRYKPLAVWIVCMLVAIAFYISGYTPGTGVDRSINWLYLPAAFAAKIGAIFSAWPSIAITGSMIWGGIICAFMLPVTLIAILNSFRVTNIKLRTSPELLAYFCFIFLSIGLIAFFRSTTEIVLENRFKIYAAMSAVFFYMFLVDQFSQWRKPVLILFTTLAFFFFINSYFFYTPEVVNKHSRYVADSYNWPKHRTELCNFSGPEKSMYFLTPAYEKGYWKVPNAFTGFDDLLQSTLAQQKFNSYPFLTQHFLHEESNLPQLFIGIENFPLRRQHPRDNLFIVLHDDNQGITYLAGTLPKVAGWRRLLTTGTYLGPGFSTVIPLNAIQSGQYRLGCLLKNSDSSMELNLTNQMITINQAKLN